MSQSSPTIVVVEDEPITRAQLVAHLEDAGFATQAYADGVDLLDRLKEHSAAVVLLDIRLPGTDGLTLTREIRTHSDIGVILVTSRTDQIDRIVGLESGADDYVTKPFDPRELTTRIRNLVRRVEAQRVQVRKAIRRHFDGWTLDLHRRELRDPADEVRALTAAEYQLLLAFVDHAGEVMSRDQIMTRIRNREWYPDDRYIDVLVGQLRRKLGETASNARLITTVHGTGYLFTPEVA